MILRSSARGHRPPGGFRCTCPPSPIENGGGLTGCPLIPTQARPPPRWGTTRGVWSTGARSPRALGTCDGHDLSVAPGRPPRSWPSPSPVRRPPPPGRRPPAPGSPPSGQLTIDTPFAVRSWGLDEHRELAITASSRSPSSAIFSPTRRQRPATPRRWQVTRTAARSAAPERFPPAPASTSAARPGDAALHEPHVPRPRPPWFVLPRRTVTEDAVAVGRVGDVGPSAANLHDQGLAPASPAGAKRGRSGRRTAPTVLATCHQLRRRGRGRPRARPPRRRDHGAPLHRGCGRSEVSSARYAARVASWSRRPSSQASRRRSAPGQTRRPPWPRPCVGCSSAAAEGQGAGVRGSRHPLSPVDGWDCGSRRRPEPPTPAESQVAVWLADGKSVRDMATATELTEGAIYWHLK